MKQSVRAASALAFAVFAACAAPNPRPSNEPAPWRPPAETKAKPAVEPVATGKAAAPADSAPTKAAALTEDSAAAPGSAATKEAAAPDIVVARVAGQPIYVSELLSQWLYLDNFRVRDQLVNLAMGRLVLAEASRLRVKIDADTASKAYEDAVAAIENEIQNSEFGHKTPNMTLDYYFDHVMGLDPIRYRERLRDDAMRALLGERVTRAWLLEQEHAELHVLVVSSEDDVKAAQKDLADGQSFEDVARKRSIDPSKKDGGALTPLVRSATPLSKAAFDVTIGAVAGPISSSGMWLLFRVDARPKPLEGDWARIGPAVEDSLKKRHVDQDELKQWHDAMKARYSVDLSPFLDLVHEPQR
jgi:peptidyl-prolyl cis-trans isomerase C